MLIGLLSDTHIAFRDQKLPPQLKDVFKGVDLILHAGDIWVPWVLDELETIAPVLAAQGDDDMIEVDFVDDKRITRKQVLNIEGNTIWVTHIKPRYGLIDPTQQSYISPFSRRNQEPEDPPEPPDVVVFGHSHFAEVEEYKNTILINPGSPTMPSYIPKLGTVGLLTINSGEPEACIVQLE